MMLPLMILLACLSAMYAVDALAVENGSGNAARAAFPITDIPKVEGISIDKTVADWKGQGLLIHALAGEAPCFVRAPTLK